MTTKSLKIKKLKSVHVNEIHGGAKDAIVFFHPYELVINQSLKLLNSLESLGINLVEVLSDPDELFIQYVIFNPEFENFKSFNSIDCAHD